MNINGSYRTEQTIGVDDDENFNIPPSQQQQWQKRFANEEDDESKSVHSQRALFPSIRTPFNPPSDYMLQSPAAMAQKLSVLSLSQQQQQQQFPYPSLPQQQQKDYSIQMTAEQLLRALEAVPSAARFSLREMGVRKMKQLLNRGVGGFADGVQSLSASSIFLYQDREEASEWLAANVEDVYLSLPFFSVPPQCRLIYSSLQTETPAGLRKIDALYARTTKVVLLV